MKQRSFALYASLGLTIASVALVYFLDLNSIWSLCHFKYLGGDVWIVGAGLLLAFGLIVVASLRAEIIENGIRRLSELLWGRVVVVRLIVAAGFTALFYYFQVTTGFLGDGYFLLNIFGRNEAYTAILIKPLSIWIIKALQTLYGGYTYWNALYVFQTVSFVAGFIVVYNFIRIAGRLTDSGRGRLFSLALMLGSGWLLLFFGYIEYYPLLWLAASFLVLKAIECARGNAPRWLVWLIFLITAGLHMQVVYFLPGLIYLQFRKPLTRHVSRLSARARGIMIATVVILLVAVIASADHWLSANANPFLALMPLGRGLPDYTLFSLDHLLEILNLALLLVPSILCLLALAFTGERRIADPVSTLLGLCALGGLTFLVTMDPKLGLARDWDLMSLTLLAPLLYLLYRIGNWKQVSIPALIAIGFISGAASFSYLHANCVAVISEVRFFDLLQYYGSREKGGWTSLTGYLESEHRTDLHRRVVSRMAEIFPDQEKFDRARRFVNEGNTDEGERLIRELLAEQPEHGLYMSALADIRVKQGRFDEAITLYRSALKTHPHHYNYFGLGRTYLLKGEPGNAVRYLEQAYKLAPGNPDILAELCRGYASLGRLDTARRYADELLAIDSTAPDGLITCIFHAERSNNRREAAEYYRRFLEFGSDHPEYETIKQAFAHLAR